MASNSKPKHSRDFSRFRQDLIELMGENGVTSPETDIYSDMLYNVGLVRQENFDMGELRLLNTAFKELRYALKVFKPYRQTPKAAVFGSARTPRHHPAHKFAEKFGKKLAKKGWMLITGGASGIMEAAMIGAGAQNSFGLNIMLPFEQDANSVIKGNAKLMYFKYFFTRKLMFLKESEATVLFPGGFGTFDEGFESFTLVQTGKAKPRPLQLLDPPGSDFWASFLKTFKKNLEGEKYISKGDLGLMRHYQDADKAVKELVGFHDNYHSSRFLREQYLIRLKKPISAAALAKLNKDFKWILTSGQIEILTDVAADDVKDPALHRLLFYFNRSSYAGLRQLIDHLNTL